MKFIIDWPVLMKYLNVHIILIRFENISTILAHIFMNMTIVIFGIQTVLSQD